jgi:ABC transporter substrate binding protein
VTLRRLGQIFALVLGILGAPLTREAQRSDNVPRIGYLVLSSLADPPSAERQALLVGLRELAVPGTIDAARHATKTIPIVIPGGADPVASGLVTSLAPGGNITGTTFALPEMAGKRLALLKEAFPRVSRVAVLWNPAGEGIQFDWQETQAAARAMGLALQSVVE